MFKKIQSYYVSDDHYFTYKIDYLNKEVVLATKDFKEVKLIKDYVEFFNSSYNKILSDIYLLDNQMAFKTKKELLYNLELFQNKYNLDLRKYKVF